MEVDTVMRTTSLCPAGGNDSLGRWEASVQVFQYLRYMQAVRAKRNQWLVTFFMAIQSPLCAASDLGFVKSMLDIHRFQTLKSHRWDLACSQNMTRPINRREKESGWGPEATNYRRCVSWFLVRPKICLIAWKVPLLFICRWRSLLSDSLHQWLTPRCY